jgi:hypothetical protein
MKRYAGFLLVGVGAASVAFPAQIYSNSFLTNGANLVPSSLMHIRIAAAVATAIGLYLAFKR